MSNISISVQVPKIEGYEYTGEHRCPVAGEYHTNGSGYVDQATESYTNRKFFILRRAWVAPSWMTPGLWLYKFSSDWFLSKIEPTTHDLGWSVHSKVETVSVSAICKALGWEFIPPVGCYKLLIGD